MSNDNIYLKITLWKNKIQSEVVAVSFIFKADIEYMAIYTALFNEIVVNPDYKQMEIIEIAIKALDKKKASDITCLDVSGLTILADYFVICAASSTTQLKALAEGVEEEFVKAGIETPTHEGRGGAEWLLLDCGDVIVHIFYKEMREFYGLDKLWDDAKKIDIDNLID